MIILLNKKFLVADKQRYRRLCLSVRRSVGPLVMIEAKSGKKSILDTFQACLCVDQVCQLRVMTEFETITLIQNGAVDFKTITVFLFPKFNRQPFFRDRNLMQCLHSRLPRNKFIN